MSLSFKYISSSTNREIKLLSSLKKRKYRYRYMLTFVEGVKFISDIIKLGIIEKIYISETAIAQYLNAAEVGCDINAEHALAKILDGKLSIGSMEKTEQGQRLRALKHIFDWATANKGNACRLQLCSDSAFGVITTTDKSQGVIATVNIKRCDIEEIISKQANGSEKVELNGDYLYLDRVQDPGNMGTIIRSARAFGYAGIIIGKGCIDVYSDKVVRASAGMIFSSNIIFCEDVKHVKLLSKYANKVMIASVVEGGEPLGTNKLPCGHILVIGNEGAGVASLLEENSHMRVTIPMEEDCESLNVAVAASIIMSHREI